MVTKCFMYDSEEQKKELLWSLDASGATAVAQDKEVSATFEDSFALVAWAQVYRRTFGALPREKAVGE